jgi:protein PhnA
MNLKGTAMALKDLLARAGSACEFCGDANDLDAVDFAPAGEVLLCQACRGEIEVPADHWRCLEGAAWSIEPAVQLAVWRKLGGIDAAWAAEAREAMVLLPEVAGWADTPSAVEHRDSNGAVLVQGDTVVLIKDLVVKGANFTAKRGTAVRGISLVADNAAQIEGRVEGQRIVILTEFVKKR